MSEPIPSHRHGFMRPAHGVVRCCLCFEAFHVEDLSMDEDGVTIDVCVPCHDAEKIEIEKRQVHE
jgi:hypothetical protein